VPLLHERQLGAVLLRQRHRVADGHDRTGWLWAIVQGDLARRVLVESAAAPDDHDAYHADHADDSHHADDSDDADDANHSDHADDSDDADHADHADHQHAGADR
jgi:hypothetical protein